MEEHITLVAFREITGLDTEDFEQCKKFIEANTIYKLNTPYEENEKGWREVANEFIVEC
jgi:hypothetical protein